MRGYEKLKFLERLEKYQKVQIVAAGLADAWGWW